MACNEIYGDIVKVGVTAGVPHLLTLPNELWCTIDVVWPKPKFLVGVVQDDGDAIDTWWYCHEDHEFKEIGSKDCVLLHSWYLGSGWAIMLSSSKDLVLSHAPKFCNNIKP
jgi:hypothetical protein